jgi:hypothetical protein
MAFEDRRKNVSKIENKMSKKSPFIVSSVRVASSMLVLEFTESFKKNK